MEHKVGAQSIFKKRQLPPPRPEASSLDPTPDREEPTWWGPQAADADDRGFRGSSGGPLWWKNRTFSKEPKPRLREKQSPLSPLTLTLKSMLRPPEVISVIHISDQEIFENQV